MQPDLKYFLSIVFCLIFIQDSFSRETKEELEISLLSCSSSDELYAAFGHSAIHIKNNRTKEDIVYDFGIFDFNTPFFVWKFLKGDLEYHLSRKTFEKFVKTYRKTERSITEEKFNFGKATKQRIKELLEENYKPENRYYAYDFLMDNCSTRIRDLILKQNVASNKTGEITDRTFRDNMHVYLNQKTWLKFGIDVLLGIPADRKMTFEEQMFLPNKLSENLGTFKNAKGEDVLESPKTILKFEQAVRDPGIFRPLYLFSFLFLLTIFFAYKRLEWVVKVAPFFLLLIGFVGVLVCFMWFGARHEATKLNLNILWAHPLYLLVPFLRKGKGQRYLLYFLLLLNIVFLLLWLFGIQNFNPAVFPIVGISLLMLFLKLKNSIVYK